MSDWSEIQIVGFLMHMLICPANECMKEFKANQIKLDDKRRSCLCSAYGQFQQKWPQSVTFGSNTKAVIWQPYLYRNIIYYLYRNTSNLIFGRYSIKYGWFIKMMAFN